MSRFDFSEFFADAWYQAMAIPNVMSSFRVTGVCPFNRAAIKLPSENTTQETRSLAERSGLGTIFPCIVLHDVLPVKVVQ